MKSDTIAAIATGMTNSGISIIRVSGPDAVSVVDQIFVLEDGEIKEQGKYQILVRKNGYFKKLYNAKK